MGRTSRAYGFPPAGGGRETFAAGPRMKIFSTPAHFLEQAWEIFADPEQ
jgi:hypothetical protein